MNAPLYAFTHPQPVIGRRAKGTVACTLANSFDRVLKGTMQGNHVKKKKKI